MSKIKLNLSIKYTPAETNVAEWINEEAGTGASIESGNQAWPPNCADLIKAAPITIILINSNKFTGVLRMYIDEYSYLYTCWFRDKISNV